MGPTGRECSSSRGGRALCGRRVSWVAALRVRDWRTCDVALLDGDHLGLVGRITRCFGTAREPVVDREVVALLDVERGAVAGQDELRGVGPARRGPSERELEARGWRGRERVQEGEAWRECERGRVGVEDHERQCRVSRRGGEVVEREQWRLKAIDTGVNIRSTDCFKVEESSPGREDDHVDVLGLLEPNGGPERLYAARPCPSDVYPAVALFLGAVSSAMQSARVLRRPHLVSHRPHKHFFTYLCTPSSFSRSTASNRIPSTTTLLSLAASASCKLSRSPARRSRPLRRVCCSNSAYVSFARSSGVRTGLNPRNANSGCASGARRGTSGFVTRCERNGNSADGDSCASDSLGRLGISSHGDLRPGGKTDR